MPRGSAGSSSRRQGPHNQNNHQQNGHSLAPLVKRPTRSRSPSNAGPVSSVSSSQSPGQEASTNATMIHAGTANEYVGWDGKGPEKGYPDCLGDDMSEANGYAPGEHRKIDINPANKPTSAGGVPSTVLPSFPLLDTIMLLIIFLQLPSTVLTIIHFLFASLTFVPPSTTLLSASTTSTLPSFTNLLLQGSNGAPSLLTIIFADLLVGLVSMFLWPSARVFLIDFAQAVIAISLGAGTSSQSGGSLKNAAVCAGVMSGVKVVQGRFKLSDAWDTIQPSPAAAAGSVSAHLFSADPGSSAGWIRSVIAVHIVAQGVMRATRRWLIRRPDLGESSPGSGSVNAKEGALSGKQKDKDPEAAAGVTAQPSLERENSFTTLGRRKKKDQIQHIRNHQPLWATMASAMVHIAKEVEQSQVSSEALNPSASENSAASGESTSAVGDEGRVWITRIGSTDIGFAAGFFGIVEEGGEYGIEGGGLANGVDGSGKDGSFPFFVRVNGIVWPQTEITRTVASGDSDGESGLTRGREDEWMVEITGLTGATEYDFEFVKKGGIVIYKTSACTMPAQASSVIPNANPQKPSRPLSPITTLLNTLTQANSCLSDQKNRLKSVKKAHKSTLAELRKDIERHRSNLGNDRGEERAFRRNLALKEAVKRAEEEHENMAQELDALKCVPEKMKTEWKEKKKTWREEKDRLKSAQSQAGEEKSAADRRAMAVESEAASLVTKKEKLAARVVKLRADLGKLETETSQGVDARVMKQADREALQTHRSLLEKEFSERITRMEKKIIEFQVRSVENWNTVIALEHAAAQQQQQMQQMQLSQMPPPPPPPPALVEGNNHSMVSPPPGLFMQHNSHQHHHQHHQSTTAASIQRERSSSMFSSDSIITNMSELEAASAEFMPAASAFGVPRDRLGSFGALSTTTPASLQDRKGSR